MAQKKGEGPEYLALQETLGSRVYRESIKDHNIILFVCPNFNTRGKITVHSSYVSYIR